jgi:hypothetical protein
MYAKRAGGCLGYAVLCFALMSASVLPSESRKDTLFDLINVRSTPAATPGACFRLAAFFVSR